VIPALTPIEAGACLRPAAVEHVLRIKPVPAKPVDAFLTYTVGLLNLNDLTSLQHPFGKRNAHNTGQVVVAGAGKSNGLRPVGLP
jgi:hypothetical protein